MIKFRLGSSVQVSSMGIRVKDRDKMIDFYRDRIGFSLLREENALAIMGVADQSIERFYLEESPRADAHFGQTKKLNHFVIEVSTIDELNAIWARLAHHSYDGVKRIVNDDQIRLEIVDPEENKFQILFEPSDCGNQLSNQAEIDRDSVDESIRLSDSFRIRSLQINVLDKQKQLDFIQQTLGFESGYPIEITLVETKNQVASMPSHEVVGLEFIRLEVSEEDFLNLESHLNEMQSKFFIDKKKRILTIYDPSGIEWWFDKV